jgi:hypothetical protein
LNKGGAEPSGRGARGEFGLVAGGLAHVFGFWSKNPKTQKPTSTARPRNPGINQSPALAFHIPLPLPPTPLVILEPRWPPGGALGLSKLKISAPWGLKSRLRLYAICNMQHATHGGVASVRSAVLSSSN